MPRTPAGHPAGSGDLSGCQNWGARLVSGGERPGMPPDVPQSQAQDGPTAATRPLASTVVRGGAWFKVTQAMTGPCPVWLSGLSVVP